MHREKVPRTSSKPFFCSFFAGRGADDNHSGAIDDTMTLLAVDDPIGAGGATT